MTQLDTQQRCQLKRLFRTTLRAARDTERPLRDHGFLFGLQLALGAFVFFFNDTATTEIYTLSLHDALPISRRPGRGRRRALRPTRRRARSSRDRKSTRLNSSHANISYAVFCLKKKNTPKYTYIYKKKKNKKK